MEPKTNDQKVKYWVFSSTPSPCHIPSFLGMPQSPLIWLLLQHAVAQTRRHDNSYVPLSLHLRFYFYWLSGHRFLPPGSHRYGNQALPSQFLLDISLISSPHPCSWSSTDSSDVRFLTLSEGIKGRAGGTVLTNTTVQWCPRSLYSVPAHALTHPGQATASPACFFHGKCLK